MSDWNPAQYLKFADERTRPCRDLAARVSVSSCEQIVDLGCGPANSTAVLAERWPEAAIVGVDSSAAMIDAAGVSGVLARFEIGEIDDWSKAPHRPFDLIFSNAAMQWVPDRLVVMQRCIAKLRPRGQLAVQVPHNLDAPPHAILREMSAGRWASEFTKPLAVWAADETEAWFDALASVASNVDLWTTTYQHVMADANAIVEWYRGTGLRPYLEALANDAARARFLDEYRQRLGEHFTLRPSGGVLFPFERLFVIATR